MSVAGQSIADMFQISGRGPMVVTHLGGGFYPMTPRPEEIFIEDIAYGLSNVPRYGGQAGISVAQHSVLVAAITPPQSPTRQLEALLHDAEEALGLPDLATQIKELFPGYQAIQRNIAKCVFARYGLHFPEHTDIHFADRMAVAIERRDLVSPNPDECWRGMPEPMKQIRMLKMNPERSHDLFLWAFDHLSSGQNLGIDTLIRGCPDGFDRIEDPAPSP